MSAKLGELLVRENLITSQQLREALDHQRVHGGKFGATLVKLGFISDDMITSVVSRQYGVPSINLDLFRIEPDVIKLISEEVARKYCILPISKMGPTLTLAMADPTNVFAMDDIKFMTGLNVEPVIASESSLQTAIGKYYGGTAEIDIFDAAYAVEAEKVTARNGNGKNGHSKNGNNGSQQHHERLVDEDLAVQSLDDFVLGSSDAEEFEVIETNEEIDLGTRHRLAHRVSGAHRRQPCGACRSAQRSNRTRVRSHARASSSLRASCRSPPPIAGRPSSAPCACCRR